MTPSLRTVRVVPPEPHPAPGSHEVRLEREDAGRAAAYAAEQHGERQRLQALAASIRFSGAAPASD